MAALGTVEVRIRDVVDLERLLAAVATVLERLDNPGDIDYLHPAAIELRAAAEAFAASAPVVETWDTDG